MQENIKKFFHHFIANHSILFFASIVVVVVIIGTICFHFIEGRKFFDSFYFTTVTMSTIGYGDMAPLTYGGKIMSIIYGFMGAPLFIGLTGLLFQAKFQKLVKISIHAYNKELKEAEKIREELQKENKLQKEKIKEIKEELEPVSKKHRRKFW